MTATWIAALVALPVGAAVGAASRLLLARLDRGASIRPGLLEPVAAVVWSAGTASAWGSPRIGLVIWAGALLVALSAVDLLHHRLPDALTYPAMPLSMLVVVLTQVFAPGSGSWWRAVLAGAVLSALFGLLAFVVPAAMGWGDVKLMVSLGILLGYLSWATAVVGVAGAFVLGAIASVVGMVLGRLRAGSSIPFGPFLLLGTWVTLAVPALTDAVVHGI